MNRIKKNSIIALAVFTVFIAFVAYSMMKRFDAETSKMKPLASGTVVDNISAVKDDFVNLFFLENNGKYIVFDSGNKKENILSEMLRINLDPDKVTTVFLTHSDADHVGGLKAFKNAEIFLPEDEVPLVDGSKKRMLIFGNKIDSKYSIVKSGCHVTVGSADIYVVAAPGHTPGSVCYIVNGKYLFSGDTMSIREENADVFNEFFNMDTELQKKTIGKILNIDGWKYIFTAHYGYSENKSNFGSRFKKQINADKEAQK